MPSGVASAFTWSPDDRRIAFVSDGSVMTVDVKDGTTTRLTDRVAGDGAPRPEACVYSPDGTRIAFVRRVAAPDGTLHNQIFVADAAAESVEDR
jgi:Tol biopolymer transport system component